MMATGSVFKNNTTQAVTLPAGTRFPKGLKRVNVRVLGSDRILSPIDKTWDSFFLPENKATKETVIKRGKQEQAEREPLDVRDC
jgi:antitoxin VapB